MRRGGGTKRKCALASSFPKAGSVQSSNTLVEMDVLIATLLREAFKKKRKKEEKKCNYSDIVPISLNA